MAKIKAKKSEEKVETKVNNKKIKNEKIRTEEGETLHRFLIIFITIIVLVVAIYLITALVTKDAKNDDGNTNNTVAETNINYNVVNVGTILNKNQYDKYYVMVYNSEDNNAVYYSTLISKYTNKEKHDKIFFCDLASALNKEYAKEESNPSAQKVEDFAFGEVTLLEIQKGRITKYVENIEEIKTILQ